jgi:UDP-N-acetylglucosamine acyltransferase
VYGFKDSHLYAAGKAFLDGIAQHRKAMQCRTLSFQLSAFDYNIQVTSGYAMNHSPELSPDSSFYTPALFSSLRAMTASSASSSSVVVMNTRRESSICLLRMRHAWDSRLYTKVVESFDSAKETPSLTLNVSCKGIHASAVIDATAVVDSSVSIGPFVVIEAGVILGPRVCIGPFTVIQRNSLVSTDCSIGSHCNIGVSTSLGKGCVLFSHVVLTGATQLGRYNTLYSGVKMGFDGAQHAHAPLVSGNVCVKNYNVFREDANVQSPLSLAQTLIGNDNYFMCSSSVGHDNYVGDGVTVSNKMNCAGFSVLQDHCWIGMGCNIHQFSVIGAYAMVGMGSVVSKDIPPFSTFGRGEIIAMNEIGMTRQSFTEEQVQLLLSFYSSPNWASTVPLPPPPPASDSAAVFAKYFHKFRAARKNWGARQRHIYPFAFISKASKTSSPLGSVSSKVVEMVGTVLQLEAPITVSPDDNLFEVGLDSMLIARFVYLLNDAICKDTNVVVQTSDVFEYNTISALTVFLIKRLEE